METSASDALPEDWGRIRTIDSHAEGEPLRVILDGFPQPEGETVLDRRRYAREHLDHLRRALMWEPRGHADMYGCLVMPPITPEADISVLFLHNDGFSTMCGHGIIAATTTLLEMGELPVRGEETEIGIDTPAGHVRAIATCEGGRVSEVRFVNVPSFALELGSSLDVDGLGRVEFDLAFGGAFYAYVDADRLGLELTPSRASDLIHAGRAIKSAVSERGGVIHPDHEDLSFLYGTIFTGRPENGNHHSRHVCVFADGEVDRSPTGTGVSGRLAILAARGEIDPGQRIIIESIVGGRFSGRIVDVTGVGDREAIVPEVGGRAFITGLHEFVMDPEDPWKEGFLVR